MDLESFLRSTPPEINWKIEARNDARRDVAMRDYNFALLLLNGHNNPKKFPKFETFYPEKQSSINEDQEMRRQAAAVGMRIP